MISSEAAANEMNRQLASYADRPTGKERKGDLVSGLCCVTHIKKQNNKHTCSSSAYCVFIMKQEGDKSELSNLVPHYTNRIRKKKPDQIVVK